MGSHVIKNINEGIMSYFTGLQFLNLIGWLVFGFLIIGGGFYVFIIYRNKRVFNKKITAFTIVGENFIPDIRDLAKIIRLGKGGFEILYLKKLKTWKLAYGGRVGKDTYYFFIMPDGYWYNGMLSSKIFEIDKLKGLIPIITTNPSMRAQYTALEKQIDKLHEEKKSFMDKYGVVVFSIGFLVIAGVFLWLNYKQFVIATSNLATAIERASELMESISRIAGNVQGAEGAGGLVPV